MFRQPRLILIIGLLLALPFAAAFAQEDAQPIVIGTPVSGELSADAPRLNFQFAATNEQIITITLTSDDFDPFLTLTDSEGQTLATNDDGAGGLDSRIARFLIPADGLYTVIAQSYNASLGGRVNNDDYGAFELSVVDTSLQRIEYGMTIEGELTPDALRTFYTFRGDAGDTIVITLLATGESWDTYLNLYPELEQNVPLVSNDDGAGNLNSMIGPYVLPEDGLYTIEATSFGNDDTGTFSLSLQRAEVAALEYGESAQARLSAARSFAYYQFTGTAGDIVDLTAEGGAVVGTSLILNGPDGYQVGYSDSYSGADPTIRAFQLPSTGSYTILVRTLEPDSEGSVTINLEETILESLDDGAQTLVFSSNVSRNTVTFTGNPSETITLTLTTDGEPSSSLAATVTQSGTTLTYISASSVSEISARFIVPASGLVLVQVDDYSYMDSEVTVSIERGADE